MAAGIVLMWTWGAGEEASGSGRARAGRRPPRTRPLPTHLRVGLGEQLDDTGVRRGHHAMPVDLDDAVPHAHAPTLRYAPPEEAANLEGPAGAAAAQAARARGPHPHPPPPTQPGVSRCRPPRRSPAAGGRGAGG